MNRTADTRPINWARIVSFVVLLVIIGVIGVMFFRVMQGFLLPLFLAALIVVIFRPVHNFILERTKQRKKLAALISTMLVALIVQVPISWALMLAVRQGAQLSTTTLRDIAGGLEAVRERFGWNMPYKQELDEVDVLIRRIVPDVSAAFEEATFPPPNAETLVDLQLLADETMKLEQKMRADRAITEEPKPGMIAAQQELLSMNASLNEAMRAARTIVDQQLDAPDTVSAYRTEIRNLGIKFESLRYDLLGGFPWSHLILLMNPTPQEEEQWLGKIAAYLTRQLWSLTGSIFVLGKILLGIAIMLISVYFFFVDGPDMIHTLMRLSPLDDAQEAELITEFAKVSRAVVLATLLSAIIQGLLAGIGYFFAGLHSIVLLTVLTTMLAMVPFVGAVAVWLPISLYLIFVAEGHTAAGIGLAIYGMAVISMADNVVKPYILHGQSNLHPLLALLSVLGGVQVLGPIGILVGPMLVAFLQALLNILRREITTMSNSPA